MKSKATAQVNLRMDDSLKKETERIFDELGMEQLCKGV